MIKTETGFVSLKCTGPNEHCRKAHRKGLSVHIIPHNTDEGYATLETYHYATIEDAIEAARNPIMIAKPKF